MPPLTDKAASFARTETEEGTVGQWQTIESAPKDIKDVLVCFEGQFGWVVFVAPAFGAETRRPGYAAPTHWMPLPAPPAPEPRS